VSQKNIPDVLAITRESIVGFSKNVGDFSLDKGKKSRVLV